MTYNNRRREVDTNKTADRLDHRTRLRVVEATNHCCYCCSEPAYRMDGASDPAHLYGSKSESSRMYRLIPSDVEDNQRVLCGRCMESSEEASAWTLALTVPGKDRFTVVAEGSLFRNEGALWLDSNRHAMAADQAVETVVYDIIARTTDIQVNGWRSVSAAPTRRVGQGRLVLRRLMAGWYTAVESSPLADRITALTRGDVSLSDQWAVAVVVERSSNPVCETVTIYVEDDNKGEAATELAEFLDVHATPAYAGLQRID